MIDPKIEVTDLKKHFKSNEDLFTRLFGWGEVEYVKAVDGVSFDIAEGESFGLAGESGCGKTTCGKSLLHLLEPTSGSVRFDGRDVTDPDVRDEMDFRTEAQIIQQNPYESINPRYRVFDWIKEPLDVHEIGTAEEREETVIETIESVGLNPPEAYMHEYPSELSGGERQRVSIARAIILEPSFILADEPASMLDVSVRASILDLLDRLQEELGISILYISHDLSLLKHMCDRIGIMYLGKLVEVGSATEVINDPQHPYTKALVGSTPTVDPDDRRESVELQGEIPDPVNLPSGCRFAPRCPEAMDECTAEEPAMYPTEAGQQARCVLYDEETVNTIPK
ncbi:ABC transporter ATP-binding protein [Natrarchaeobius halalkaliphilus]|nr:ABC transporter ATP-binding protein [Natrarchaeobius halalkaliphilus]